MGICFKNSACHLFATSLTHCWPVTCSTVDTETLSAYSSPSRCSQRKVLEDTVESRRGQGICISDFFLSWHLSQGCVIAQTAALAAWLQESHLRPHWPSCPGALKEVPAGVHPCVSSILSLSKTPRISYFPYWTLNKRKKTEICGI